MSGRIGYFTGDPLRLLEDAQILKPNFFPSVPRILNRVYQAAMAGGNVPGVKGAIFRKALQVKLDKLHTTGESTHVLWDRLVFRKVGLIYHVLAFAAANSFYRSRQSLEVKFSFYQVDLRLLARKLWIS